VRVGRGLLTGALSAAAVVGAHFTLVAADTTGMGVVWPVAAAGAFAAGAYVGGRGRADLHVDDGEVTVDQLHRDLDTLRARVRTYGGRLPGDVQRRSRDLLRTLDMILQRGDYLTENPEALHVVGRTIRDYLPTSLETYMNLPRSFATQRRIDGRRTAYDELTSQLDLLQVELSRVEDAVYRGQAQSLTDQSRFLEEKFRRSELDLE
jgi:hypothetical protein